jgi:hypothetical protein
MDLVTYGKLSSRLNGYVSPRNFDNPLGALSLALAFQVKQEGLNPWGKGFNGRLTVKIPRSKDIIFKILAS